MGLSTYAPDYSLLDWPADVSALAKHLGFKRFHVMGGSGGGPCALACAHTLSSDILRGIGVLAGMGPPEAGFAGTSWQRWLAYQINIWLPRSTLRRIVEVSLVKHAQNPDPQVWEKVMHEQIIDKMPAKDCELFQDPEIQARLIDIIREAF
jgi:pimeloyl-ACP methyl ester carboxylesterase